MNFVELLLTIRVLTKIDTFAPHSTLYSKCYYFSMKLIYLYSSCPSDCHIYKQIQNHSIIERFTDFFFQGREAMTGSRGSAILDKKKSESPLSLEKKSVKRSIME